MKRTKLSELYIISNSVADIKSEYSYLPDDQFLVLLRKKKKVAPQWEKRRVKKIAQPISAWVLQTPG